MLPIFPCSRTKLFGEWMARACEQPFGIRFCALRCQRGRLRSVERGSSHLNLIPMLFNRLKQGKAPAIFGDDATRLGRHYLRARLHPRLPTWAPHIAALKYLDRDERKYDAFSQHRRAYHRTPDRRQVKKVTGLPVRRAVAGPPRRRSAAPDRLPGASTRMGWHAKYDVENIVKSAWDARPTRTPHRRRHQSQAGRLRIDGRALDAAKRFRP